MTGSLSGVPWSGSRQAVNPKRYLLLMTDGLSSYTSQARVVFRDKVVSKLAGRPRQVVWETLLVANVVKQYSQRRVTGVIHRIKHGAAELVEAVRHRAGGCARGCGWWERRTISARAMRVCG